MEPNSVVVGLSGAAAFAFVSKIVQPIMDRLLDWAIGSGWNWLARLMLIGRGGRGVTTLIGAKRFDGVFPLDRQVAQSQVVYAAWLSGRGQAELLNTHSPRVQRLILPNPESESIARLEQSYRGDYAIAEEIRRRIERLQQLQIPYRLCPSFWGVEITIGDPEQGGWAHCCPHVPGVPDEQRVFYRIEAKRSPEVFRALVKAFDAMWLQSSASSIPDGAAFFASRAELTEAGYIKGKHVRIADVVDLNGEIPEKTFEDCTVYGPAVIAAVSSATTSFAITDCSIEGPAEAVFIRLSRDQQKAIGMLRIGGHVAFRRCRLRALGIAGHPDAIDHLMRGAGLMEPLSPDSAAPIPPAADS